MDAGSHTAGVRVRRVEFGMEWPPGHVAAYLLDADEPADIEHVLLTHPHVDHIGQVQTVIDEGDPEVYAPGHQADHLCYATGIGTERALLAGDMVIEPFRAVALHDGIDDGYRDAFAAFFAALDRLAELEGGVRRFHSA